MTRTRTIGLFAVCAAVVAPLAVQAQATGFMTTVDGRTIEGTFRWKPAAKTYMVMPKGVSAEMELALDKVADLRIAEPAALKTAVQQVQSGAAAVAVPALEKIATEYTNLQWDRIAVRYLVDAYIKSGDTAKALQTCERAVAANPEAAYQGEIAVAYWRTLLKAERVTKLDELLDKAVQSGDQYSSAFALMLRGDRMVAKGESKENRQNALKNGYLRVVMLYRDVPEAQPEALYKAMKSFEALGQSTYAEKMRTRLTTEFGSSEWARK